MSDSEAARTPPFWSPPPEGGRARPATFRPTVSLDDTETRVPVEQTRVVDPERLGRSAGRLNASEPRAVDEALTLVLGL